MAGGAHHHPYPAAIQHHLLPTASLQLTHHCANLRGQPYFARNVTSTFTLPSVAVAANPAPTDWRVLLLPTSLGRVKGSPSPMPQQQLSEVRVGALLERASGCYSCNLRFGAEPLCRTLPTRSPPPSRSWLTGCRSGKGSRLAVDTTLVSLSTGWGSRSLLCPETQLPLCLQVGIPYRPIVLESCEGYSRAAASLLQRNVEGKESWSRKRGQRQRRAPKHAQAKAQAFLQCWEDGGK